MLVERAAELGAAGHAHAQAQARDRDLVALVHHRAARRVERLADVGADRVAVDRRRAECAGPAAAAARPSRRRRTPPRRRSAAPSEPLASVQRAVGAARLQRRDVAVEVELRAQRLGLALEQQRELAAVADLVVRQVDGAGERRVGVERGLDPARLVGVDLAEAAAGLRAAPRGRAAPACVSRLDAQQHQVAVAALVAQLAAPR